MIGIDLGSNTLRACKMGEKGEILWGFERIVGSARGMDSRGLASGAKQRIYEAFCELKEECELKGRYFGAATAAFRKACNAEDFLADIRAGLGIDMEVISAETEARLSKLGITKRLEILGKKCENALFIDLGGASTEITFNENIKSFDFGIVSFVNSFGCDFSKACEVVSEAREFVRDFGIKSVVLSSGVPTSVAALKIGLNYANYDAKRINGMRLGLSDFDMAMEKIQNSKDADALVGVNRGDILCAGICLLKELLAGLEVPFVVIDDGLREGVAYALYLGLLEAKSF